MAKLSTLSPIQRLILTNQFRILEALYPREADYFAQHRKAVEDGYTLNYDWMVSHLSEEMSEAECTEVIDILNMYRAITFSAQQLPQVDELQRDPNFRFQGFDGNGEGKQYGYARYLIEDLERFQELRYGAAHPDLNSHMPMLSTYRRMLATWQKDKYELSVEEIQVILASARGSRIG
jgi:hypothetical protein